MKIFLIVASLIVLVIVFLIVYRLFLIRRQGHNLNAKRFDRVKTLYDKLENGQWISQDEVYPYAKNLLTRELTYKLLKDYSKANLFPSEYFSIIKAAESNLANWLEFPTELDTCPDEMEHIKRVTIDFDGKKNFVHYEVFKYRVNEPHWASKNGWMLGVVGPYFDESKPYDFPGATFSRVSSTVAKTTADEEAKWVHENISMKRR